MTMHKSFGLYRWSRSAASGFILATLTLSAFAVLEGADAKIASPELSRQALNSCELAFDRLIVKSKTQHGCCSKKLRISVICPRRGASGPTPSCSIVSYNGRNDLLGTGLSCADNRKGDGRGTVSADGIQPPPTTGGNGEGGNPGGNGNGGGSPPSSSGGRPDAAGGAGVGAGSVTGNTGNGGIN